VRLTDRKKTKATPCRTLSPDERFEIEQQLQAQGYLRDASEAELEKFRVARRAKEFNHVSSTTTTRRARRLADA
jgi:hypothetical protein